MAQEVNTYSIYDTNQSGDITVSDVTAVVDKAKSGVSTTSTQQYVTAEDLKIILQDIYNKLANIEATSGGDGTHNVSPSASFNLAKKNMKVGETFIQTVTTNSNGTVMYFSTNTSVAKVDANSGLVTALTYGETIITAVVASSSPYEALSASYTIVVEEPNILNGHEYVDLGLPSGNKWAKCNIGAEQITDGGLYFSWGDTQGYDSHHDFTLNNDKWYKSESESFIDSDGFNVVNTYTGYTKYVKESDAKYGFKGFYDNKSILEPCDDAATINWGEGWKMPQKEDYTELLSNCTWTWTSLNGVSGYKVKSGINNNYIFLPATKKSSSGQSYFEDYWSSTSSGSSIYGSHANILRISKDEHANNFADMRYSGNVIRPICK